MFSNDELEVIQFALIENIINYIKSAHDIGVAKIMDIEEGLKIVKKYDKGGLIKKAESALPSSSGIQPPSAMFDDNEGNISVFEEMQLVHKIDDLLDTEDYVFYSYISEETVADFKIYDDAMYYKSFAEYYNYFIDLFIKWEDAE
jgi:hypothetical protein